jgi:dTDP-4-dehydrorhamnose reductase
MSGTSRVLVTGCGGQLGRSLLALEWPAAVHLVGKRRADLDIACEPALEAWLAVNRFDIVVNAAAYTAVDQAEAEPDRAFLINHHGPRVLAAVCARQGTVLVHVSTDYVFDGTKDEPHVETDSMAPLGVYGRSKAAGEDAVRRRLAEHVILRTAWVYSPINKNFVKTILRLAGLRDELTIVADQLGSPTSAQDLAHAIRHVVLRVVNDRCMVPWGTYHCTNAGWASWFTLAGATVDTAAPFLARRPSIRPICAAEYPMPAARPANSRLDCSAIEEAFGIRMRPWREALTPVVREVFRRQP